MHSLCSNASGWTDHIELDQEHEWLLQDCECESVILEDEILCLNKSTNIIVCDSLTENQKRVSDEATATVLLSAQMGN